MPMTIADINRLVEAQQKAHHPDFDGWFHVTLHTYNMISGGMQKLYWLDHDDSIRKFSSIVEAMEILEIMGIETNGKTIEETLKQYTDLGYYFEHGIGIKDKSEEKS